MVRNFHKINLIDNAETMFQCVNQNVVLENETIKLIDKYNEGFIESCDIECDPFTKMVASWVAITDKERTVEVMISVRVDGKWSKYLSYGAWGLGRENYYYNDEDELAEIYVDEIYIKNGKNADGVRYKIVLRKDGAESPLLKNICIMLHSNVNNYEYEGDNSNLPSIVEYNVPRLNQNIVPVIGEEMCSATTTAMLLKYYGFDFSEYDEFEHRYVAGLVADPGHNAPTYGNWAFNTAVIGAFGLTSFTYGMTGWEELKHHLATVGPVGASIRGDTGVYKTPGHLLVVIGYKIVNGETFVVCNDPNINSRFGEGLFVRYEYPLEVFMNFWRKVVYTVTK